MGVSYSAYVGVCIEIKPNKTINVKSTVYGCQKCKTQSSSNFCSTCGSPKTEWSRSQKVKMEGGYEYLDFVLEQMGEKNDEDEFYGFEGSPVIVSNKTYYCKTLSNNYDERLAIDFKVAQTKVKEFEAKYEEFLQVMRKSGIEFDVVYGVIATAS